MRSTVSGPVNPGRPGALGNKLQRGVQSEKNRFGMLTACIVDLVVWGLRLIEANGLWFEASSAGCLGPMVRGLKVARPPNKVALKLL